MLIPLLSVSLIGLVTGMSGLTRRAPSVVLIRCMIAAWLGFAVGAVVGVFVEALVIGGFWLTLVGHVGAFMLASRTAQVSTPKAQRRLTG
ncbi:hypothetical protein BH23ACT9_BH23ACT9_37910 [soil metagenome]